MSGPDDDDSARNAANGDSARTGGDGARIGGGGARTGEKMSAAQNGGEVLAFPQSRAAPPRGKSEPFKDLGTSNMCQALGMPKEQTTGHWCSHCKGIWFGYLLEVECPICGGRDG